HSTAQPARERFTDRNQREVELRNKAILQQQRRLKQATQFVHKDSADLLPLDGLKRLGTSKDLQPHSVVQRRLLEENLNKLRGETREYTTPLIYLCDKPTSSPHLLPFVSLSLSFSCSLPLSLHFFLSLISDSHQDRCVFLIYSLPGF
uniref:Nuclear receptor interacting protein 2 n=1 Tax=Sphenodon punctatus TaxID=8508 RepID=A0A8D0HJD7_SPHPU